MGSWKGLSGETLHGGLLHDPNELSVRNREFVFFLLHVNRIYLRFVFTIRFKRDFVDIFPLYSSKEYLS